MLNFNPALMQTQNVQTNTIAALAQANSASKQLNDVLLNAQRRVAQKERAQALVDAANTANNNSVLAATVANDRLNSLTDKQHDYSVEDATVKNKRDLISKILQNKFTATENSKSRKNQRQIGAAHDNTQLTLQGNRLADKAFDRDQNFDNSKELVKLRAALAPTAKGVDLTKDSIKLSQSGGGLDGLIDKAVNGLNDKDLVVRGLDDTSRSAIRGLLIQKLQDPKEQLKFNLNPKKYALNLMDSSGGYDWNFHPSNLFTSGSSVFQRQWNPDSKK